MGPTIEVVILAAQKPLVLLLAGPGGAGKTSTAARIAQHRDWEHVSEDDFWVTLKAGHPWGELRTPEEERVVQAQTLARVFDLAARQKNVVLEFILYEDPPRPLLAYRDALAATEIDVTIRILRPRADEVMRRMVLRGRERDANVQKRQAEVEHQLRCLGSEHIRDEWVIDTSDLSLEETYQGYFRQIVERPIA